MTRISTDLWAASVGSDLHPAVIWTWVAFDFLTAFITIYLLWRLLKPKVKELAEDRQPPE